MTQATDKAKPCSLLQKQIVDSWIWIIEFMEEHPEWATEFFTEHDEAQSETDWLTEARGLKKELDGNV